MTNGNKKAKWRETKKRSFGTKNTRWKKMTKSTKIKWRETKNEILTEPKILVGKR